MDSNSMDQLTDDIPYRPVDYRHFTDEALLSALDLVFVDVPALEPLFREIARRYNVYRELFISSLSPED